MSTLWKALSPLRQRRASRPRRTPNAYRPVTEPLEDRTLLSGAGLLLSQIFTNPSGSDSPFEYVQLIATQSINFATTPYSVVFEDSSSVNANGWNAGGVLTYGFNITTGTVNPGDVVYVGGVSMSATGTKLRTINTVTTAGDGFGGADTDAGGVLGNGGSSADAAAIFNVPAGSITSTTVPIDAVFFGSQIGSAFSSTTTGYQLPVNDHYSGGFVPAAGMFLAPDPGSNQWIIATGSYDASTNTYSTTRSWALSNTAPTTSGISLAPTVTSPTSASITSTGATLGGNVTSAGSATVTERGVLYAKTSDNPNPQLGGANVTKVTATGTTGVFTTNVSGLLQGTAYSFVAYATNSIGTAYTTIGTFNTVGTQNRAPVLSGANNLTTISASIADASNTGSLVSALIAGQVTDPDAGALAGIAITAIDDSNGVWQYSTNGGSSWTPIGAVSNTSALLLAADASSTKVRFVPNNASVNGSFGITFRAWDQITGTAGTMVDTSTNGGSSAFSSATANSTITVNSVNTAPVNTVPGTQTIVQGTSQVFSAANGNAISIADADAGTNPVQVTLTAASGTITLSGLAGLTFLGGDGTADTSMTFTGTMTNINAAMNGMRFTPTASFAGTAGLTILTNDLGNTGSGGPLTDTDTVSVTVVPGVLINEIEANPPGNTVAGDIYQYVELIGAPGASLTNLYFVELDGNGATAGTAEYVMNLTGATLGTNGLLMIKSPDGGHTSGPGTTVVTDPQFDQAGGALGKNGKNTDSFYLVYSTTPIVESTDYDTNNDGAVDGAMASALTLDNVGWSDGNVGAIVYGGVSLKQSSGTPDAATRFVSNATPSSAAAWYNGDLYDVGNDPTQLLYDATRHSANMPLVPSTPSLTPGAPNFDEPPVVVTTAGTDFYLQNTGAAVIDPGVVVTDGDNPTLQSATVQITTGYVNGQDILSFTNTSNITGSFNTANGTLTLTGTDTVANYQAALRTVQYANTSSSPNTAIRTVTFSANDGTSNVGSATKTITVLNPPIISEFLASNSGGLEDAAGETNDWIEIYNPSATPIDLLNWSLTDKSSNLEEWTFPDVTVGGHQFLVVFADGENITTGSELHTNFSLSASGEYLALVDPNGVPVTQYSPQYPTQLPNVSYGAEFDTADLVDVGSTAQTFIPTDNSLGTTWTNPAFTPTGWITGPSGVGFGIQQPGFNITYDNANVALSNITQVAQVLSTPSLQATPIVTTSALSLNYMGTGGGGHFTGDTAFPTQSIGSEFDNFVIQATGSITIPTTGNWSFDVNSDDGFQLTLSQGSTTFTSQFATGRGAGDTIGIFNIPTAGAWNVNLQYFQGAGGAELEFAAAAGSLTAFTSAFQLVGGTGGLAVNSVPNSNPNLIPGTNIQTSMLGKNASAYIRIPFTVTNPTNYTDLTLNMYYDDGFALYLNGTEIVSRNAPATLSFNSAATVKRAVSAVATPESIDLTQYLSLLQSGTNVLAIQGLNVSASDSSFLVVPQLIASAVHPDQPRYFTTPTPGAINSNPLVGLVQPVTSSKPDGYYTAGISVTLSDVTPGATIMYTTDGSVPTATHGTVYTGPLSISSTTPLRAQGFETGYISLPSVAWTYLYVADIVTQEPHDAAGFPTVGATPAGWPATWGSNVVDYGLDQTVINTQGVAKVEQALQSLPTISLTTDLSNLFDPTTGIYANADQTGDAWRRPASLELINPNGTPGFQIDAGISIRGGASRTTGNPKHSFHIYFGSEWGGGDLNYPLFGPGFDSSFDRIDLRTGQNNSWSGANDSNMTLQEDPFERATMGAMGQLTTDSLWINLYIDGQYWGIYQIEERVDQVFAANELGGTASNYDIIRAENGAYTVSATQGNLNAYDSLWSYVTTHDMSNNANYYFLQGMDANGNPDPSIPNSDVLLDVDNLIDFMLVTYQGGNLDAPISNFLGNTAVNNFFAVRDETGRQGFLYVQHDAEWTFQSVNENRIGPYNAGGPGDSQHFNPQYLFQVLTANAEFRTRFADIVQADTTGNGPMTNANMLARYQASASQLNVAIIGESARWGDAQSPTSAYTITNWQNALVWQEGILTGRNAVVLSQFVGAGWFPTLGAPTFDVNGIAKSSGQIVLGSNLTFTATGGQVYYTLDGSDPREIGGGISPTALVYTPGQSGPALVLSGSEVMDARTYNGTTWSPLSTAALSASVPAAAGNLAITELQYDPIAQAGATTAPYNNKENFEFIEFRNIGTQSIDLSGVNFTSGVTFNFSSGTVRFLDPGESVVIVSNLLAFEERYGSNILVAGAYTGNLSNSGEQVTLVDATGAIIQSFTYADDQTTTPPWPSAPHGQGPSLTVVNVNGIYDDPANWVASTAPLGTPGYEEGVDVVPLAPTNVQGTVSGYISTSTGPTPIANRLSWTGTADTISYTIERKIGAGGTYAVIGSADGTAYADSGLVPGTAYFYEISAVNAVGGGPLSAELSVTTPAVPSPPTAITVTRTTASSIALRWTDTSDIEDGFQIYRSTGTGALTLVTAVGSDDTPSPSTDSFTDTGLTPGTIYNYVVRAFNVSGFSDSASLTATTLLTAPSLFTAQESGTTATLYFTEAAGATSFNVYRGTSAGQETLLASNVTASPYVDSTLQTGVTYFYYVTAVNGLAMPVPNESSPSSEVTTTFTGGGTFTWSGGGTDNNWSTAGNWVGSVAPTGVANETLKFPSGATRLASVDNFLSTRNFFAGISVATGGYTFSVTNNLSLGSGGLALTGGSGSLTVTLATTAGLYLATNSTLSAATGTTLTLNTPIINESSETLSVAGAGNLTISGGINGSGGLNIAETGTGNVTLNGVSGYTGPTAISSGTVNLGSNTALGAGTSVSVASGATVALQGVVTPGVGLLGTYYNATANAPSFNTQPSLTAYLATLTPALTALSGTTSENNAFDFGTTGVAFPVPYNSGSATNFIAVYNGLFTAATAGTYTFDTGSDDGSMLFIDGNVVVSNNFSQGVTVRSGSVALTAGTHQIEIAYYQGGGGYGFFADVQVPGGTLQRIPNTLLSAIAPSNVQIGSLSGAGTIQLGTNQITVGSNNQSTTFTGAVTGSGANGVTKTGTASLVLSKPQYTGATNINSGVLQLGNGVTPLASLSSSGVVDNGTLVLANPSGTTLAYANPISGAGGLTVMGGGTLGLSALNPYQGPTHIAGGVVNATLNASVGSNSALTVDAGASLNLLGQAPPGLAGTYYNTSPNGPDGTQFVSLTALNAYVATLPVLTTDRSSTSNGQNVNGTVFDYGSTGAGFPASILTNPNDFVAVWSGQFNAQTTGSYTFDTGSDDGSMIFIDGNVVVNNNFSQAVTVRSGTVSLSAGSHSIVIAYYEGNGGYGMYADVLVPGGTLARIPNSLLGTDTPLQFGSLAGGGTVTDANANVTMTIGSNNLSTVYTGVLAGGIGIKKIGTGSLTLAGANTFSGGTAIATGTLLVNGSLSASSAVSVAAGAVLGGTGTVGSVTSLGTVNPGAPAPGTLTTGSLGMSGSNLVLNLSKTGSDSVKATGAVNITGTTLSLNVGTITPNEAFTILSVPGTSGGLTGKFANLPNSGSTFTVGSLTFTINYAGGDGNDIVLAAGTAVPTIVSTVLNGGIPYINSTLAAVQHSMVENVVYSFNQAVGLTAANFTLSGINGTTTAPNVNVASSGGGTVWTVTFTGAGVNTATHSIGDGEYALALNLPGLSSTFDFFRLLGDMDGTGTVDTSDFTTLISTFLRATTDPFYLGADDFDGDGSIGATDFTQFAANFQKSLPAPLGN